MRKIRLSARAEKDLLEIWQFSFQRWDDEQADKYVDELDKGIQLLAENPELGSDRAWLRAGYRVLAINQHAIWYTATAASIRVVRILPGQMDPERHL